MGCLAASIFAHVAEHNVVVDDIIQTVDHSGAASTSFTVEHSDLAECKLVVNEIRKQLNLKEVICNDPVAKVSVVGVGMRSHTGVAQKMFDTLSQENINILMISTSEIKVSCVIEEKYTELAVRVLHKAFGSDEDESGDQ